MDTIDFLWIKLGSILVLTVFIGAAKRSDRLPSLPLALFVMHLAMSITSQVLYRYTWSGEWARYFGIMAAVLLAWAVARIVFFLMMELPPKLRPKINALPKITRDFLLFVSYVILLLIVLRFRSNVNLASLLTTSAVVTVVIGLAAQATLSNFFSGLIIQAEHPFNIGDWIQFEDHEGIVAGISWKSTQILTREQVLVYIPNSVLSSSTFMNYSKPTRKKITRMFIGVEYDASPSKVNTAILEVIDQHPKTLNLPRPHTRLVEFGDFAITYEIRFWIDNFGQEPQIKADINKQLWYRLRRYNIRIPFPIRDVYHGHIEREHNLQKKQALQKEIESMLEKVPILSPLSSEERKELSNLVKIEVYGAEELIVQAGEVGDSMYIIRYGVCEAFRLGENHQVKMLSTMKRGDFFGEISLLTGENRTASIKAVKDTALVVINKEIFAKLLTANPHISEEIGQVVIQRQSTKGVAVSGPTDAENSNKFISKIKQFFGI
jgi:small-conductance mechanosensitive channel